MKALITVGDVATIVGAKIIDPRVWVFLSLADLAATSIVAGCGTVPTITDFPSDQDFCDIGANFGGVVSGVCTSANPGRALGRFQDWLQSVAWPYFCECTPGPGTVACATLPFSFSISTTGTQIAFDSTQYQIPTGATTFDLVLNTFPTTGSALIAATYQWSAGRVRDISGTSIWSSGQTVPRTQLAMPIPSGRKWLSFSVNRSGGAGTIVYTGTGNIVFHGTCVPDGTPYVVPPPPATSPTTQPPTEPTTCPTLDPCTRLNALDAKLQLMLTYLQYIQRQGVPAGYTLGTSHAGLTGSGSLAVSDILGLLVTYTVVPAGWGHSSDNPNRYIPAPGSVSLGTAGGQIDAHWVNNPSDLYLPPDAAAATVLKYHFKPGVHATIQEVSRVTR